MELSIQPLGIAVPAEPGANLLTVLQAHQIPVSYSCMAGRCGTCRCKVVKGQVLESGLEKTLTNPHADSYILACMSTLTESCTIEIPEPDEVVTHPARILKATVVSIEAVTHDIRRILMKPAKSLEFSPGQYATLQFTKDHIRPYSMAGLPTDELLEFHVRLVPEGRVSGYIEATLKSGDSVRLTGPLGTAYLRRKHTGPMLCIAGGTGLAPVLSIVRGALEGGMTNPVHVYFGVRSKEDVYAMAVLDDLQSRYPNLAVHVVVTLGDTAGGQRSGLVTDAVNADWASLEGFRVYLCGSPPMVDAATILVERKGVPASHIYADAFYASAS